MVTFIDTFNKECTPYLTITAQGRGESDDKKERRKKTEGKKKDRRWNFPKPVQKIITKELHGEN